MVHVRISPPLRRLCDRHSSLPGEGSSVREVLSDVLQEYPELSSRLFPTGEQLDPRIQILLNKSALADRGLDTELESGAVIDVIFFIGGG